MLESHEPFWLFSRTGRWHCRTTGPPVSLYDASHDGTIPVIDRAARGRMRAVRSSPRARVPRCLARSKIYLDLTDAPRRPPDGAPRSARIHIQLYATQWRSAV